MVYRCHRQLSVGRLIAAALFLHHNGGAHAQPDSKFDICKVRLDRILNGTETFRGIDNITVHERQYIYHGAIGGMRAEYAEKSRHKFVAITTAGCKAICEDPIDWYWESDPTTSLGIISNWILPIIALLAALPYDSGSSNPKQKWTNTKHTLLALRNWLGSPQTALAATFFNIHQMRKCLSRADRQSNTSAKTRSLKRDAYYVLCCIGQFELPAATGEPNSSSSCFLDALVYGLFKPVCDDDDGPAMAMEADPKVSLTAKRWIEELLQAMACQMRRSRRLGVWSTCASILLFFVAYAVSVVMAFGDLGERTTTHSLAFGILITWFPLLLFFSILDRNPNSADRTR